MLLIVQTDATVRCPYSEELDLAQLGSLAVRRGSRVEPDARGRWLAALSPVDGPLLGPYAVRSQALQAERRWLEAHRL